MDCKKMEEIILTDYVDGRITGPALKGVESHLALCGRCRALLSELTRVSAEIKKAGNMVPRAEVWEKIRSAVSENPAGVRIFSADRFFESVRSLAARLRPAIVVATAAALILAVLTVARLMPQKGVIGQDELMSLITLDENGNGQEYEFGTPEENYFL